jgi:glycosyltransferase involved in cell wall biosynthesis
MRILALTKYGPRAASTRQRIMIYEPALRACGMQIDYDPLLDDDHIMRLSLGRGTSLVQVARAYLHRLRTLLAARHYDLLWINYELFPYLPWVERLAAWSGRPYVLDYDDATFHTYDSAPRAVVRRVLGGKLAPLLGGAKAVVCGNAYLQDYAAHYAARTLVIPTVVDTDRYEALPTPRDVDKPVTIGWIGSPTTWANVRPLLPMLARVCREHRLRFLAVGAGAAASGDCFDGLELHDWTEAGEVRDVQAMDIGIMPLLDQPFERGKCGYKLIQYMACGLPVVASPIGVNSDIVDEGKHGLLVSSEEQWEAALVTLIRDPDLRRRMGAAGRERAVERYSLQSQAPRLVALLQSLMPG